MIPPARFFALLSFSLVASSCALAQARLKPSQGQTSPEFARVLKDIEYAREDGEALLLDLYLPKWSDGKIPVIMWVHGGGWKQGSKEKPKGLWLIEHGFAVASIDFRLIPTRWPAQINDCRAAVRFLRSKAPDYNLDGDHIAAWGGSSGGHLVALLGTQDLPKDEEVSSRVQAVLDWYGPADLLTMPPNVVSEGNPLEQVAQSNGAKLLGATVRDVPDLAKEASAFWNVSEDDPPFLIMHGDEDPGVPVEQSIQLFQKQKEMGAPTKLHIVKGAKHGGKEFLTDEVNQIVLEFFTETLKSKK